MVATSEIKVQKISKSRIHEVDFSNLGFGKEVTDHMFVAEYKNNVWRDAQIIPFSNISLAPNALALHYGQTVFEGMKAFRMTDGRISIFRLNDHFKRFNISLRRMCMPEISYELFSNAIIELIKIDEAWLKNIKGTSLYIRPFMIATEERFGVKVSEQYKFFVFAGAVGEYYSKPLKVKVEPDFTRAVKGGTGFAKCGGNYGGSFYPTRLAQQQGFDQIIWTDSTTELNIEESGTMNVMFVMDGVLTTPTLSETILSGITRDSLLKLASELGYEILEQKISFAFLENQLKKGKVSEAFGCGTAAVISAIEFIHMQGIDYKLPACSSNNFSAKALEILYKIRLGEIADDFNWNTIIE